MPKIVDYAERRSQIAAATWRVIARRGITGATMRDIAAEAGFSNGALKPYFATKHELLRATFEYVFQRTNERVRQVTAQRSGFSAVLAFGREVLPLDADRRDEARAVIAFWQEAALDAALASTHSESMVVWRRWVIGWIEEAVAAGWARTELRPAVAAEVLLGFLLGSQITTSIDAAGQGDGPAPMDVQLEAIVDSWRAQAPAESDPGQ